VTLVVLTHSTSVRAPPGTFVIKKLVQLKEHASDDLRRSDAAWAESQSMCETTTTLLRQETEEAARKRTEIDAHVISLQLKFNQTKKLLFSKRKGIDRMTVDISTIVNGELKEAKDKLTAATRKLNKAIDAARPENSRLTLAIAKTDRIIDSIKENTAAAASKLLYLLVYLLVCFLFFFFSSSLFLFMLCSPPFFFCFVLFSFLSLNPFSSSSDEDAQVDEDAEEQPAAAKSDDADVTDASDPASSLLLEIDDDPENVVEDVGPRFVAAIVKLNDLKIGLEKLRNNSMQVFELKRGASFSLEILEILFFPFFFCCTFVSNFFYFFSLQTNPPHHILQSMQSHSQTTPQMSCVKL